MLGHDFFASSSLGTHIRPEQTVGKVSTSSSESPGHHPRHNQLNLTPLACLRGGVPTFTKPLYALSREKRGARLPGRRRENQSTAKHTTQRTGDDKCGPINRDNDILRLLEHYRLIYVPTQDDDL